MKKVVVSIIIGFIACTVSAQSQRSSENQLQGNGFQAENTDFKLPEEDLNRSSESPLKLRSDVTEWRNFSEALYNLVGSNSSNIYSVLFPDTITVLYEDNNNPGMYTKSIARNHSVGVSFCPKSFVMEYYGYEPLEAKQPYKVDSFGIYYNYMRFTDDNVVDTLVINVYKPSDMLYYHNNEVPKGNTVRYDSVKNKGKEYTDEIVYLLTKDDVVPYGSGTKGLLKFGLVNYDISSGGREGGMPVGITWSFKPGYQYSLSDTINGDFNQDVPHSDINHFFYWNFNDYDDNPVDEYNCGMYVYTWSNWNVYPKYKIEGTYGPTYWRGLNFSSKNCIPQVEFLITYDDEWQSVNDLYSDEKVSAFYPVPASDKVNIDLELSNPANVNIELLNNLGQKIKVLSSEKLDKGQNTVRVNLSGIDKGVYFCRISIESEIVTRTLVVQ